MSPFAEFLSPAEAAKRLGVSAKALRLYEQRGLIAPIRSGAGWRAYGPAEMARAGEVVALRALGLSLAQVARVIGGEGLALEAALAAHQAVLESQMRQLSSAVEKVRRMRADLATGGTPASGELGRLPEPAPGLGVAFDLPWPWGGERFELDEIWPLTFIVGPLGSGKTRLAKRIAACLPNAAFLGLDRFADEGAAARAQVEADQALKARVDEAIAWLAGEGATVTPALAALMVGLKAEGPAALVVDTVDQGLDKASQEALIAYLRLHRCAGRSLFLMTRSNAILDLSALGPDETILFCPANHSPPRLVAPRPGALGYEAVASCLASPDVRARTEGMIAWHPRAA